MVLAKPFCLRCPTCKQPMKHFTEILFVEGFLIVVNGVCCGSEITSGELEILKQFPTRDLNEKVH